MKPIVLFDLDNTLLQNSLDSFLPGYLKAWMKFIAPIMPADIFISAMMAATDKTSASQASDCTLREVFDEIFYPAAGLDKASFSPLEVKFYSEIFPTLKDLTQPIPGAAEVVEQLHSDGHRLALASNPLFPLTAIQQRLDWAGLHTDETPFEFIPSMETFHFTKPDPAFFAELLASLGWPETQVVMVGDHLENDIIPASSFGIATFWINGSEPPSLQSGSDLSAQGTLEELPAFIDRLPQETWQPTNTPSSLLASFRSTLAVLDTWSRKTEAYAWNFQSQPGEWSPVEILSHLTDVDNEVNIPRLSKLLHEDNPFLPGIDTDRWAMERKYHQRNSAQALLAFRQARLELLKTLGNIQPAEWQRPARHAIFGRTSLVELVGFMAGHDRLHIRQVYQALHNIPSFI